MVKEFFLAFIPIFVAVDALGLLPIYISLTEEFSKEEKKKLVWQSTFTALCVAIGFIFIGRAIFDFLKITVGDFMIAGGIVLFAIALRDILSSNSKHAKDGEIGVVPLGTPLITGPAVLTTSLILTEQFGIWVTLLSITINILLAGIIFSASGYLMKIFGTNGSRAFSKVAALLLAAIAVMMARKGVLIILQLLKLS